MAKLVTKTYADALFTLATEEKRVDEIYDEILVLKKVLDENPDLSKLMNHPNIDKEEKLSTVSGIFKGRVSDEVLGFLIQIVTKDRYGEIDGILDCFIDEVKDYKKIGVAYVTTPSELNDAQKARIEKRLLETTDFVKMEMNYSIDESLIGGMKIRIGDRVVDSSISTKLSQLASSLRKLQLDNI